MPDRKKTDPVPAGTIPVSVGRILAAALDGARGGAFPGSVEQPSTGELEGTDPALLRQPLGEILVSELPDLALVFLHGTGLLGASLPEVTAMIDFRDEYARHKDLWTHTIRVVAQVDPDPILRWAALLHDIGKVATRSCDEHGRIHFLGHEVVGARMFRKIARRLRFPADQEERIRFLIRNHLRAGQYDRDWTDSAVRRFGVEVGPGLDDLLSLSRADITTKYESRKNRNIQLLEELLGRVSAIREQDAVPPALPKGLGISIMERHGLEPGPVLGRIMHALEDLVNLGVLPRGAGHQVYLDHLATDPRILGDALPGSFHADRKCSKKPVDDDGDDDT